MSERSGIDVVFVAGPPGAGKTTVTESYQQNHPRTDQFGMGELVWGVRDGRIESQYASALQEVAARGLHMPDELYSKLIQERILQARDSDIETMMVTGFPHGHGDWNIFTEAARAEGIIVDGAVTLHVGLDTSIARMQERDVKKGIDPLLEERSAYEKRYYELMGRHMLRLDCYRSAGLHIEPIFAERPPDVVLADFTGVMNKLKEGMA